MRNTAALYNFTNENICQLEKINKMHDSESWDFFGGGGRRGKGYSLSFMKKIIYVFA